MILYVYVLHWKLFFRIAVFKKTKSAASKIRIDIEAVLDYSFNVSAYHSGQRFCGFFKVDVADFLHKFWVISHLLYINY